MPPRGAVRRYGRMFCGIDSETAIKVCGQPPARGGWGYLGHGKFGTKSNSFFLVKACCLIFVMQLHLTQY